MFISSAASIKNLVIVPFVATLLKGRFVVFLKWLFLIGYLRLGYIGLGDFPTRLGNSPRRVRVPRRG